MSRKNYKVRPFVMPKTITGFVSALLGDTETGPKAQMIAYLCNPANHGDDFVANIFHQVTSSPQKTKCSEKFRDRMTKWLKDRGRKVAA